MKRWVSVLVLGAGAMYSGAVLADEVKVAVAANFKGTIERIGKEIEKDLTSVANAARQLANDRFVLDWVERGMPKEQESILINQLKDMTSQYGLVTASFADRQSAAYYNQDGFLRILNHEQDNWFYDYTKSRQDLMLSIFRESNGEV